MLGEGIVKHFSANYPGSTLTLSHEMDKKQKTHFARSVMIQCTVKEMCSGVCLPEFVSGSDLDQLCDSGKVI